MIDDDVPNWLKNTGGGWITAEYSMLPGSTSLRNKGRPNLEGSLVGLPRSKD